MAMRTLLVCAVLALGYASSAWPQRVHYYLQRYIAPPVAPTAYETCDALRKDYDKEVGGASQAHEDCLQAHANTARGDERGTCSVPRCQGLHDQRDQLSQKRSAAVDECRHDVARYLDRKRRDEANRQAAEAERRARDADQRARDAKRRDEQHRRERDAAEAERKREEQREKRDLVKQAIEGRQDLRSLAEAVKDPLGTLERNIVGDVAGAKQDTVGKSLLRDASRDPKKGSDHEFILRQVDELNARRQDVTNPFAYEASEAALRHTGRVQAGALEQWDKATGDLKALLLDTPTGANPFASTIRPLPSPGPRMQTTEAVPSAMSPAPSQAILPTGEVLAGSGPSSAAPSSNPFASSAGTHRTSGSTSIVSSAFPPTEAAIPCFYNPSSKTKVCLGVPNNPQQEKSCWLQEGTLLCPQRLYEREHMQALGQRPSR